MITLVKLMSLPDSHTLPSQHWCTEQNQSHLQVFRETPYLTSSNFHQASFHLDTLDNMSTNDLWFRVYDMSHQRTHSSHQKQMNHQSKHLASVVYSFNYTVQSWFH